ncbi:MAG: c-type cytochrome [Cyanobacteria bacterium J06628_3]
MKKIISILLLGLAVFSFGFSRPALADAAAGGAVFNANCAACHAGGRNLVQANKSLSKEDLEKYEMHSVEKITYQVNNGKNAMPAFKGRLSDAQIQDVADYVLSKADAGW